jgi:hypothetical protein
MHSQQQWNDLPDFSGIGAKNDAKEIWEDLSSCEW